MVKKKDYSTLAVVFATIAGFMMIATTMFFSVAQMGVDNNNEIAIEISKFKYEHGVSLQNIDPDLNNLIIINDKLVKRYSTASSLFFFASIIMGAAAIFLAWPKE